MSLKNTASKKASTIAKNVRANAAAAKKAKAVEAIRVKLSEASFSIIAQSMAEEQQLVQQSKLKGAEVGKNITLTAEAAGYSHKEYDFQGIDPQTKELILVKKKK